MTTFSGTGLVRLEVIFSVVTLLVIQISIVNVVISNDRVELQAKVLLKSSILSAS